MEGAPATARRSGSRTARVSIGAIRYTCGMQRALLRPHAPLAPRPNREQRGVGAANAGGATLWLAFALAMLGCSSERIPRPDVLLVTVGAFPIEMLACHGGSPDVGSGLCSVAEEGSRFVWAFAAADTRAPAAATLLSGLEPADHGVTVSAASFLRSDVVSIAEHAAAGGYATAAFVADPGLNRSRHLDQGFTHFEDASQGYATSLADAGRMDVAGRATQWLATAPSPFFVWVHLDPTRSDAKTPGQAPAPVELIRRMDRDLERLLSVLDARTSPPAILVTALPDAAAMNAGLSPATTRVALLWRPPRVGSGRGVARVIRTPVSQLDVAPTLLRAMGLVDQTIEWAGGTLPFREQRAGEAGRTLEIAGSGERALVGEGVFLVIGDDGQARRVALLPLTGERAPALEDARRSSELVSRIWAAPEGL